MEHRVAIVTGAGTGVGKAAALALLAEGYAVTLTGRRQEPLDKTAALAGDVCAQLGVPHRHSRVGSVHSSPGASPGATGERAP